MDRNTSVSVNGYGLNFTENQAGIDSHITTFDFTTDAVADTEDWVIDGFNAFNAGGVDLTNLSILDLSALGVDGLVHLNIVEVAGNTFITSNEGLDFDIELVGVAALDLSNENFVFA